VKKAFNIRIGGKLRARREYLDITREKMSEIVDISPQFLSEVERGVKGLSAEKFMMLCEGLGLSADQMLWGKENQADVSPIVSMLATLDEAYIPLVEDVLKTVFFAISMKPDKQ